MDFLCASVSIQALDLHAVAVGVALVGAVSYAADLDSGGRRADLHVDGTVLPGVGLDGEVEGVRGGDAPEPAAQPVGAAGDVAGTSLLRLRGEWSDGSPRQS